MKTGLVLKKTVARKNFSTHKSYFGTEEDDSIKT